MRRWWGSDDAPLVVCDIDLRVGGSWRYVTRDGGGTELGWHGTYRGIDEPQRIVTTEVFEGYQDGEALDILTLHEEDGVTEMRVVVLHSSRENRDGHIASGMEAGMQVVMDRLEDLVRESAQPDTNNAVRDAALQDTELRDAEMQATETQDASGREASR